MNSVSDIVDPSQIYIEILEHLEQQSESSSSTPAEVRTQTIQQKAIRSLTSPTKETQGVPPLPFKATVYAKIKKDPGEIKG